MNIKWHIEVQLLENLKSEHSPNTPGALPGRFTSWCAIRVLVVDMYDSSRGHPPLSRCT